jgi:signal peptidase I
VSEDPNGTGLDLPMIPTSPSPPGGQTLSGTTSRPRRKIWLFFRDIVLILVAALVISFGIKTFLIRSFYIPSPSMTHTLEVNDRVIVSLLTPSAVPLQRGDVVVFTDPDDWLGAEDSLPRQQSPITDGLAFLGLTAPDDNDHLIKRVIGLPGDTVACCSAAGKLTVNGVALSEPYINLPIGSQKDDPFTFSVKVPKGDLWVMGDNRYESADSAYHYNRKDLTPFVPIRNVTGRAVAISWPIGRWTILGNYPTTFQGASGNRPK